MASDRPRYLDRDVARGITLRPDRAVPGEPEPVAEDVQAELTRRASLAWAARRRAAWDQAAAVIGRELDRFEESIGPDPPLVHALRPVRRSVAAVTRRLASR